MDPLLQPVQSPIPTHTQLPATPDNKKKIDRTVSQLAEDIGNRCDGDIDTIDFKSITEDWEDLTEKSKAKTWSEAIWNLFTFKTTANWWNKRQAKASINKLSKEVLEQIGKIQGKLDDPAKDILSKKLTWLDTIEDLSKNREYHILAAKAYKKCDNFAQCVEHFKAADAKITANYKVISFKAQPNASTPGSRAIAELYEQIIDDPASKEEYEEKGLELLEKVLGKQSWHEAKKEHKAPSVKGDSSEPVGALSDEDKEKLKEFLLYANGNQNLNNRLRGMKNKTKAQQFLEEFSWKTKRVVDPKTGNIETSSTAGFNELRTKANELLDTFRTKKNEKDKSVFELHESKEYARKLLLERLASNQQALENLRPKVEPNDEALIKDANEVKTLFNDVEQLLNSFKLGKTFPAWKSDLKKKIASLESKGYRFPTDLLAQMYKDRKWKEPTDLAIKIRLEKWMPIFKEEIARHTSKIGLYIQQKMNPYLRNQVTSSIDATKALLTEFSSINLNNTEELRVWQKSYEAQIKKLAQDLGCVKAEDFRLLSSLVPPEKHLLAEPAALKAALQVKPTQQRPNLTQNTVTSLSGIAETLSPSVNIADDAIIKVETAVQKELSDIQKHIKAFEEEGQLDAAQFENTLREKITNLRKTALESGYYVVCDRLENTLKEMSACKTVQEKREVITEHDIQKVLADTAGRISAVCDGRKEGASRELFKRLFENFKNSLDALSEASDNVKEIEAQKKAVLDSKDALLDAMKKTPFFRKMDIRSIEDHFFNEFEALALTIDKIQLKIKEAAVQNNQKFSLPELNKLASLRNFSASLQPVLAAIPALKENPELNSQIEGAANAEKILEELGTILQYETGYESGTITFQTDHYNAKYKKEREYSAPGAWKTAGFWKDIFKVIGGGGSIFKVQPFFTGNLTHASLVNVNNNAFRSAEIFGRLTNEELSLPESSCTVSYKPNFKNIITEEGMESLKALLGTDKDDVVVQEIQKRYRRKVSQFVTEKMKQIESGELADINQSPHKATKSAFGSAKTAPRELYTDLFPTTLKKDGKDVTQASDDDIENQAKLIQESEDMFCSEFVTRMTAQALNAVQADLSFESAVARSNVQNWEVTQSGETVTIKGVQGMVSGEDEGTFELTDVEEQFFHDVIPRDVAVEKANPNYLKDLISNSDYFEEDLSAPKGIQLFVDRD